MNKKKKKYLIDKIILILIILLTLFQIGNFIFFNSIDTFYFEYLFINWSKQIHSLNKCKTSECDNNSMNLFGNTLVLNEMNDYDFFNLNFPKDIKKMNIKSSFNVTKVNDSLICCTINERQTNYLTIIENSINNDSNLTIDTLNNTIKISDKLDENKDLTKYLYYNNSLEKIYIFSSYLFNIHKPYLDPKCNELNINNKCKNTTLDPNSFEILSMNLSSLIKENNKSDYNGNETITLYGKIYYGLNKSNPNCKFNNSFEIIKEENDDFILNIKYAKKWLIVGLISQVILILLFLEKFIVSYIKNNNGKETLPNYVKPLLMIVSIIEFITCAMFFSSIKFHNNIKYDLYKKKNCLDNNIDQFIKPYIKNYNICEILSVFSSILSFFIGIELGIRRAMKYAN